MLSNAPTLDELTIFTSLVRVGNVKTLSSQSGISAKLIVEKLLSIEQKLTVQLFQKNADEPIPINEPLMLSDCGESLFESGSIVLAKANTMMEVITFKKTEPRGSLNVCCSTGFSRRVIGPVLSKFQSLHPKLEIQLEALDRRVDLGSGGYHLDIRVGSEHEPGICYEPIASNYRILCASPKYLEQAPALNEPEDLSKHRCLIIRERDQQPRLWRLQNKERSINVRIRAAMSSNMGEIVKQWIIDGHGVGLRSIWDIRDELESGRVVRVLPDYIQEANIVAAYPERFSDSKKIKLCLDFICQSPILQNYIAPLKTS